MAEDVLEGEAIEEQASEADPTTVEAGEARRLPARAETGGELEEWRGEVRNAALAAAGGIVAGVATVAAVNAARAVGSRRHRPRLPRRPGKRDRPNVVASRSFLVDVHVLGNK
jgi:hypothetical protein